MANVSTVTANVPMTAILMGRKQRSQIPPRSRHVRRLLYTLHHGHDVPSYMVWPTWAQFKRLAHWHTFRYLWTRPNSPEILVTLTLAAKPWKPSNLKVWKDLSNHLVIFSQDLVVFKLISSKISCLINILFCLRLIKIRIYFKDFFKWFSLSYLNTIGLNTLIGTYIQYVS